MDILAAIRNRFTPTQIRYFSWLFGLYLAFAILNALYQVGDAPRNQTNGPFPIGSDTDLYIQSPQKLTFDGQRRQGRITLTIKPRASANSVPNPSPLATAHLTPTIELGALLFTQPMTRTGCSRFMAVCLSEMGVSPLGTSIPLTATAISDENGKDRPDRGTEEQEWSFLVRRHAWGH